MNALDVRRLDWSKGDGLLPAVIQDARSGRVLMLGYMNEDALRRTLADGRVVFFSRSRNQLWTKGETSGHFLDVVQVTADCDNDTILVLAHPQGPTCHQGTTTCFAEARDPDAARIAFLATLEETIALRIAESPEGSYTARLHASGIGRIAQKVGEEGVETALAAVTREDPELVGECADLLYHLLVMLKARNLGFERVVQELASRHATKPTAKNR
ncbi:MAG TPA: bifunctional phosphoribosyl-AMP cyclohydrolase/phosphoribosyl-ATP diphosphatase HisIE [Steroidobacteraceae bacterium]